MDRQYMREWLSRRRAAFASGVGECGLADSASDRMIIDRVIGGDREAFRLLVEKYQDRVFSVVRNYVPNTDDAVDVTQDAFVKAYSKLDSFDSSSAFYTWLYRIAINTSIDFLRRRKSRPADSLDDAKYTEVGFEPACHDSSTDPVRVVTRNEQARALREAIAQLSEKLRGVLVLHDVEGLSQDEVAEVLGVPLGTVKSRVSRARSELRTILSKRWGE